MSLPRYGRLPFLGTYVTANTASFLKWWYSHEWHNERCSFDEGCLCCVRSASDYSSQEITGGRGGVKAGIMGCPRKLGEVGAGLMESADLLAVCLAASVRGKACETAATFGKQRVTA